MQTEDWCPDCENVVEGSIIWGEREMIFVCDEGHESICNYGEDGYDTLADESFGTLHIRRYYDSE